MPRPGIRSRHPTRQHPRRGDDAFVFGAPPSVSFAEGYQCPDGRAEVIINGPFAPEPACCASRVHRCPSIRQRVAFGKPSLHPHSLRKPPTLVFDPFLPEVAPFERPLDETKDNPTMRRWSPPLGTIPRPSVAGAYPIVGDPNHPRGLET